MRSGCDILVATPGRLQDLLETMDAAPYFSNLKCYVLDEVDRLLDVGFRPTLDKISEFLPKPKDLPRQNLFFSATIDNNVKRVRITRWGYAICGAYGCSSSWSRSYKATISSSKPWARTKN